MQQQFYPLFAWISICIVGCSMILVIILANLQGFDIFLSNVETRKPTKRVRAVVYFSILSLLSFIICLSAEIVILNELTRTYSIPKHEIYLQVVHNIRRGAWTFGQLNMYMLFISNIFYTFKNTLLQITKKMFIFLYILVTIFLLGRLSTITWYSLYYNALISKHYYSFPAAMIEVFTELIDLILSVFLVYIFVNRLFKLFLINCKNEHYSHHLSDDTYQSSYKSLSVQEPASKYTTPTDTTKSSNLPIDSKINSKQLSILHIAAKYAILSSVAIISTQVFLISAVNDSLSWNMSDLYYYYSYEAYAILLSMDCLINSLCICLNFDFNRVWFNMCCYLCDKCCYSLCIWVSKKCINNEARHIVL